MKNNKSLGQHWLKNREILDQIADLAVDSSACKSSEKQGTCLEIGPGLGTLASSLLKRFDKVVAVEYDSQLATNLPQSFPGKNLEVVNTDILQFDFSALPQPYTVAGNIPYYITSPIIEKLLKLQPQPKRIVLLIQKEVAERIADTNETQLSLFVKNYADVSLGPVVPKMEFTPPPKVDSQVIILEPHPPIVEEEVFKLIRQGFKAPRKKLIHNLSTLQSKDQLLETFKALNIDPNARPSNLSLTDWQKLAKKCHKST